ncbi:hypothetical protein [Nonomuraea sp. NPDC050310]|uniref:hypothetical protein n=1 Tax=Nonomuraea sp. NPDC050310 TaxID=3154935 RepID=UPI0033C4A274
MRRPLGWLFFLPALLGLAALVVPSVQTLVLSLQRGNPLRGGGTVVGWANYATLLGGEPFWRALGFTALLTAGPLLVVAVVAPLLALSLAYGGAPVRRIGRVVLSVWIVTCSPVAIAVAGFEWVLGLFSPGQGPDHSARTTAPGSSSTPGCPRWRARWSPWASPT